MNINLLGTLKGKGILTPGLIEENLVVAAVNNVNLKPTHVLAMGLGAPSNSRLHFAS